MKELSTEEKAKAYDKALAYAKLLLKIIGNATLGNLVLKNEFERMFPELKESEGKDEKIRKALIRAFKSLNTIKVWNGIERTDIIYWLEKQDEQNPVEEYNITGIGSKHAKGKLGEMIKNLKPINEVFEQKPAEWSDYDECMLTNLIDDSNCSIDSEYVHWLESIKEKYTWKLSDEQITWLYRAADDASKDSRMKQVLNNLLSDLKKLKEG